MSKKYNTPNFDGKIFQNPVPTQVTKPGTFWKILLKNFTEKDRSKREPAKKLGPFFCDKNILNALSESGIRISWLGHSTLIIEIDGKRFLTDPIWSDRTSPVSFIGPKRFFDPPLSLDDLPHLDGIIISHDHYDHLDAATIKKLKHKNIPFYCPLGVGKRLISFGVPKETITEFAWWDEIELPDGFKIAATPARHFSGRGITDRFKTLWASWVIISSSHRFFYGADSGIFPGFKAIGDKYGPFDVAALEIGAADPDWEFIHMGPKNALDAFTMLNAKLMLPIHWGTYNLAFHAWQEPIETLIQLAEQKNIALLIPSPGETVDGDKVYNSGWWKKRD